MKRRAAAAIAILAIAAACTGADPEGPSEAVPSAEGLGPVSGDRLLVLMDDGSVVTTGPDGGEVRSLSRSGGLDVEVRQPVWSPDGHTVAWAELVREDEGIRSQLVTMDPTGSGRTEYQVDTATFFLQWDPTSSRIAYLGNFQGSIGMGVAERGEDGEPTATTIVRGEPFYLSWSPQGDRLLIHVGDRTLGTLDLAGDLEALDDLQEIYQALGDRPGIFQAPVWLPDGRMVYAANVDGEQVLVVRGDGPAKELVSFEGAIEFVVSPDGRHVAYRVSEGALGGVSVVNLRSARSRRVTETPTSAFHWSPDGRRLLLMTQEEGENPQTHRWMIWEGGSTSRIGLAFLPSPTFLRDYVPFYGQFAQSMTPWSPDGASFAFPGLIDERAGIWVQDVSSQEPEFVLGGGRVVAWSPAAA
jgi:TolB protein